jgi:hypothetical protein
MGTFAAAVGGGLLTLLATGADAAHATTCAAAPPGAGPGGGTLASIDARERLRWIDERLDHEAGRARRWAYGWAIGIGAAGLGSLAPVPFVAPGDRIDWYASAATAAIGVIPFVVSPLQVTRDAPRLRADIAAAAALADDAQVCSLLAGAERKLAADAADERWQQGWWIHAGNLAFNTGVLLFLGLGYHHWTSGLINGISGAAVGETIILTQPTGAIDDARAYDRGDLGARARLTRVSRRVAWSLRLEF